MSIVIKCGTLINGTGATPVKNAVVLIKEGKVEYAGPACGCTQCCGAGQGAAQADEVYDLSGFTVLPGLIDAHVHLSGSRSSGAADGLITPHDLFVIRAAEDAKKILMSGFTTTRCCGSSISPSVKRAVEEGTITGPTIIVCGRGISQTAGHGDIHYIPLEWSKQLGHGRIADGPDECRRAVREQLRDGVDFIKVMVSGGSGSEKDDPRHRQYSIPELEAIVDEAHAAGRKVAAHAHGKVGVDNSVKVGIDTIEHGTYIDDESVQMMKDAGTFLIPTLSSVYRNITYGPQTGITEWRLRKSRMGFEYRKAAFKRALAAGLKIAAGTDNLGSPMRPHGISAQELELMVEYGMTPMQAIVAATRTAAEACDVADRLGTLEKGMAADVIAVAGDPLENISVLHDVRFIMRHGKTVLNKVK